MNSKKYDGKICGLKSKKGELYSEDETYYNSESVFEIFRYNLKCDHDNLSEFLEKYESVFESKLKELGEDSNSSLVTLLHSIVGHNQEVIEIWRHGDGIAGVKKTISRASGPKEWNEANSELLKLSNYVSNTIYKPVAFSPLI